MRTIHTTDLSRQGNDCYITESVSLIEDHEIYNVIVVREVTGWFSDLDMTIGKPTKKFNEALKAYKFAGGMV